MGEQVRRKYKAGFTIVELLIVIVVIAILAAISIVAYNGIQARAYASAIQTDLNNAKKKLLLFQVNGGNFPQSTTELASANLSFTKSAYDTTGNNAYYCYNKVTNQFAMEVRAVTLKNSYIISSTGSLQSIASASATSTCQAIGLSGYDDTNAVASSGYTLGTGWLTWANG